MSFEKSCSKIAAGEKFWLSKISRGFENRKILENLDGNAVRIQVFEDFFLIQKHLIVVS